MTTTVTKDEIIQYDAFSSRRASDRVTNDIEEIETSTYDMINDSTFATITMCILTIVYLTNDGMMPS